MRNIESPLALMLPDRQSLASSGAAPRRSVLMLLLCLVGAQAARANDSPDAAMMAPVMSVASFIAHVDRATRPPVFVDAGLVIVDDFAPYLFSGKGAAERWDVGLRHHLGDCKDLQVTFGKAHDFDRSANRVYFVLPTHWKGNCPSGPGPFEESGAWGFVLTKISGRWRIMAYAWGVYESTYQ